MDINTAQEALKTIGLDEKESKVYLALLQLGETNATNVARETNIERTLVYYLIEKLVKRGLASYKVKKNVAFYAAAPPEKILDDLKDKEKSFLRTLTFLNKLHQQQPDEEVRVEVFKGPAGFNAVKNDMFKHGKDFLGFGGEGMTQSKYPAIVKQYLRLLEEKNVTEKFIAPEKLRGSLWLSKNSQVRYVPSALLSSSTMIYADRVLITVWEKPVYNILIISNKIAQSYRSYFSYLWKTAKK